MGRNGEGGGVFSLYHVCVSDNGGSIVFAGFLTTCVCVLVGGVCLLDYLL